MILVFHLSGGDKLNKFDYFRAIKGKESDFRQLLELTCQNQIANNAEAVSLMAISDEASEADLEDEMPDEFEGNCCD